MPTETGKVYILFTKTNHLDDSDQNRPDDPFT